MALGEGMTLDDLFAAPLAGANRHALECDEGNEKWAARRMFSGACGMCSPTQEEVDAYNKMLAGMSIPFHASVDDVIAAKKRMERQEQIEYDEWVVATPKNLTSDDYAENHAAGLPITREHIVRCKDCHCFFRDASPYEIDDCPHFCSKHGIDMAEDDGFCSWGRRKDE